MVDMRLIPFFTVIFLGAAFFYFLQPQVKAEDLQKYYDSIDYTCSVDRDCTIKNIGNCCGGYPACVNMQATVNPKQVKQICMATGTSSICGFNLIEGCKCKNGRCEGVPPAMP
jgi:hypothetical protein